MTKEEVQKLVKSGVIILRSSSIGNTKTYRISKLTMGTYSHGWSKFDNSVFYTQQDCEDKITRIISMNPKKYRRE